MAPSLKARAVSSVETNPTVLGDPVSMKAEKSNSQPTENDKPNSKERKQDTSQKSLKQLVEKNPTAIGDPVSLKAEKTDSKPVGNNLEDEQAGYSKKGSKL